jgi:undecaprenyl-diphosphatase
MHALAGLTDAGESYVVNWAGREAPPWLRRAASTAGRSADGGKLWAAAATVLAVTGRSGRRAAVHGAAGYLAASLIANGLIKQLTNRPRPGALARLPGAIRPRHRRTTSLPSSHTAGAAAFAVAAAGAVPASAPALGSLALLVACDRVLSGEHYPTDVLAGAALGAATGAAVTVVARRIGRPARLDRAAIAPIRPDVPMRTDAGPTDAGPADDTPSANRVVINAGGTITPH